RRDEQTAASFFHYLAERRKARRDDGQPERHRLDGGAGKTLVDGGKHEKISGGEDVWHVVAVPERSDAVAMWRPSNPSLELRRVVPLPADDQQLDARARRRKHIERAHEVHVALLELLTPYRDDHLRVTVQSQHGPGSH